MDSDEPATETPPRLLFIDAYDSFSNNIICQLQTELHPNLTCIRIDDERFVSDPDALYAFIHSFDGVVVGPGPGDPSTNTADVGLIQYLWSLPSADMVPVLGICLGFQSLVLAFGGAVERLQHPRHGLIRPVVHCGRSLYKDVGEVYATQYHSLRGRLETTNDILDAEGLWLVSASAPMLEPLAWDLSDCDNGPILMAVKHASKPFWGVQYHPESVCTNREGARICQDWWREASGWLRSENRTRDPSVGSRKDAHSSTPSEGRKSRPITGTVYWQSISTLEGLDYVASIRTLFLEQTGKEPVILECGLKNGKPVRRETGRYSILGLVESGAELITYKPGSETSRDDVTESGALVDESPWGVEQVFERLRDWAWAHKAAGGPAASPFWGGLMGYISYEACLETIHVKPQFVTSQSPGVHFVAVRRSVVVDHVQNVLYVQTMSEADESWVTQMSQKFAAFSANSDHENAVVHDSVAPKLFAHVEELDRQTYCAKVQACQSYIKAGDSYELCFTNQSQVDIVSTAGAREIEAWTLYGRLRLCNPAPFGVFLDFDQVKIVGSSPERFLSWSRTGACEFRPIKGTVKKTTSMTVEKAADLLTVEKESAENLMIVDLVRHDLNGVLGVLGRTAEVPKLMQVEEYETVFQLVSVISGDLGPQSCGREHDTARSISGIDVLQASLPPGSMTGAPKKRSCELLQQIEQKRRGVYSGVVGYLDVGGGGDFSVVIRSLIMDENGWSIGAGGAITALSEPDSEWEEMLVKRASVNI